MASFNFRLKKIEKSNIKNIVEYHIVSSEKDIKGTLELPEEISILKEGKEYNIFLTSSARVKKDSLISLAGTIYDLQFDNKKWKCFASFGGLQFRLNYKGKLGLERTHDLYLQITPPIKK